MTGTTFTDGLRVVEGVLNEKQSEAVSPFCEPCLWLVLAWSSALYKDAVALMPQKTKDKLQITPGIRRYKQVFAPGGTVLSIWWNLSWICVVPWMKHWSQLGSVICVWMQMTSVFWKNSGSFLETSSQWPFWSVRATLISRYCHYFKPGSTKLVNHSLMTTSVRSTALPSSVWNIWWNRLLTSASR